MFTPVNVMERVYSLNKKNLLSVQRVNLEPFLFFKG